jgi:hypothetical protein
MAGSDEIIAERNVRNGQERRFRDVLDASGLLSGKIPAAQRTDVEGHKRPSEPGAQRQAQAGADFAGCGCLRQRREDCPERRGRLPAALQAGAWIQATCTRVVDRRFAPAGASALLAASTLQRRLRLHAVEQRHDQREILRQGRREISRLPEVDT